MSNDDKKLGYKFYRPGLNQRPPRIGFAPNWKIISVDNIEEVKSAIQKSDCVALDSETTGLEFETCTLVTVNIGLPDNVNYIGFYWTGYFGELASKCPSPEALDEVVRLALRVSRPYMHNRFYDQMVLSYSRHFTEEDFFSVHDTLALAWGTDTNVIGHLGLKELSELYLGIKYDWEEDWQGAGIFEADVRKLCLYAATDSYCTLELGELFYRYYRQRMPLMWRLENEFFNAMFNWMEQPKTIDLPYLLDLQQRADAKFEESKKAFYDRFGTKYNFLSNQEFSDLLLGLGYHTGKLNKPTAKRPVIMAVGEKELLPLVAKGCEPAKLRLVAKGWQNMSSKLTSMVIYAQEREKEFKFYYQMNRVPSMRLAGATYRIKNKPYGHYSPQNAQAIGKPESMLRRVDVNLDTFDIDWNENGKYLVETGNPEFNLRGFLTAGGDDRIILKYDFINQEARLVASLTGDDVMTQAFLDGKDVHKMVGATLFSIPIEEVTPKQRKVAKELCIPGDSPILTSHGFVKVQDLRLFQAWDGWCFSSARAFCQNNCQEVFKVTLNNGSSFRATGNHLIPIFKGANFQEIEVSGLDASCLLLSRDNSTGFLSFISRIWRVVRYVCFGEAG